MIIFRYLTKEVYSTLVASTAVLLLLLISNQFVHYLTLAATGAVPLRTVMQMMSLQVPLLLGLLLPLGLYVGILMGYGRLYVDREMTVLSACGLSKAQLIGMTLIFTAFICLIIAMLMFWLQPKMESYKRAVLLDAATSSPLERISPGQFNAIPNSPIVFYAQSLSRDHQYLENIFVAQEGKKAKPTDPTTWEVVVAKTGQQTIDKKTNDKFLIMSEGFRYSGAPGQADFQISQYKHYGVRIEQNALPPDKRIETYTTKELILLKPRPPSAEAELQWRYALPISAFILALIAIPLSKVEPRQGRFAQLLPALVLYIIYVNFLFMGRAWLQKGKVPLEIGLWWVHGLMLLIALFLLCRYIGWGRLRQLLRGKQR